MLNFWLKSQARDLATELHVKEKMCMVCVSKEGVELYSKCEAIREWKNLTKL